MYYVSLFSRYMLGLAGIPSFILFVGFIFMPESPRWLISTHQEERARRVLQTMRGQLDIEEEYESIKANCLEAQQNEDLSCEYWPRGYKTFFMLSSAESKIYPAHKC